MKRIALVLSFVFLFWIPAVSEAGNPVSGGKCPKAGLIQIYSSKKFTCIKLAKKLVWDKGSVIKSLVPKPTPTPTLTPTPTPTNSINQVPAKTPEQLRYEESLQEFQKISMKSYKTIRDNWPSNRLNLTINYHFTENFPIDILNSWKSQVENSVTFYDQFIDTKQVFNIYFVTEKDQKWVEDLGFWSPENFTFFDYWKAGLEKQNCQGAAAWFLTAKGYNVPQLHGGIAISSQANLEGMSPWCQHIISHEMFHAVQDYWLTNKEGNKGFPGTDAYDSVEMPIFREGSADTIAAAIGQASYEKYYSAFRQRFVEALRGATPQLRLIKSKSEAVEYLKKIELRSNFSEAHEASYMLGMLVFEYAISEYGFNKYVSLLKLQNKNRSFRDSFQLAYGFPIDELYSKSADHVLNAIEILKVN